MKSSREEKRRPDLALTGQTISFELPLQGGSRFHSHKRRPSNSLNKHLRFQVLDRDGFTCVYCGASAPEVALQVDHIVPRSRGGTDDIDNLRTSCQSCNFGKSNRPLRVRSPGAAVWILSMPTVSDRVFGFCHSVEEFLPPDDASRLLALSFGPFHFLMLARAYDVEDAYKATRSACWDTLNDIGYRISDDDERDAVRHLRALPR